MDTTMDLLHALAVLAVYPDNSDALVSVRAAADDFLKQQRAAEAAFAAALADKKAWACDKYEVLHDNEHTAEALQVPGVPPSASLWQIRALRDFGDVHAGDLGGFVGSMDSLAGDGDCWIYPGSVVCPKSRVSGNARLGSPFSVFGKRYTCDCSSVVSSQVGGNAWIYENSSVKNSVIADNAIVRSNSIVHDSEVKGNSEIRGCSFVSECKFADNILCVGAHILRQNLVGSKLLNIALVPGTAGFEENLKTFPPSITHCQKIRKWHWRLDPGAELLFRGRLFFEVGEGTREFPLI